MKKIIFLFLILFSTFACTNTVVIDQRSNLTVGFIKKNVIEGETNQSDILTFFGAPNIITTNSKGNEVWNYAQSNYQSNSRNRGSAWDLGVFGTSSSSVLSNSSTASFNFIIVFNSKGIVESYKVVSASF